MKTLIAFFIVTFFSLPTFAAKVETICGVLAGGGTGYTISLRSGEYVSLVGDIRAMRKLDLTSGQSNVCATGKVRPYISTQGSYDNDIRREIVVLGAKNISVLE